MPAVYGPNSGAIVTSVLAAVGPPVAPSTAVSHTVSSLYRMLGRIKYILRQSDIFATHFGVTLSDSEDEKEEDQEGDKSKGAAAAGGSPSKRRQAGRGADDAVYDVTAEDTAPTFLTKQPPSISGGTMRSYQLEGLNWMINLQAQGTNGESRHWLL